MAAGFALEGSQQWRLGEVGDKLGDISRKVNPFRDLPDKAEPCKGDWIMETRALYILECK